MDNVRIGEGAVVRRAIIDKNVVVAAGRAGRYRPRARRQPFHHLGPGNSGHRQGREGRRVSRVALLTREYPPAVYGGAGVHVEYLARELADLVDVAVYCFGAPGTTRSWPVPTSRGRRCAKDGKGAALRYLSADLRMAGDVSAAPTWSIATPGTPISPATWPGCSTDPARDDVAQPGAPAPMEGRAVGCRLPPVELGGTYRHREMPMPSSP